MKKRQKVLLTGVSGFLGSHVAIQLLEKGYEVIGTVRDPARIPRLQKAISRYTGQVGNLCFAEANLLDAQRWPELTAGVDYVQHVASPFPAVMPRHEDVLMIPAREGTLNVLKAAFTNGVKRVVLTSSIAAIVYGKNRAERQGPFSENDWTDPGNRVDSTPYFRSKVIAERSAWDFMKTHGGYMELTTVCPGAILGPILEEDYSASANLVIKTLDGSSPALPNIGFDVVDVRSVAQLLVLAMEHPAAAGERFIASGGYLTFKEIAQILSNAYPDRKVPKKMLPDTFSRIFSIFEPSLRPILLDLGIRRTVDRSKARQLLGWEPLDNTEAVLACADTAVKLGLLK